MYWYCKEKFCLGHSWELKGYIINWIIHAFWLGLTHDLLENRRKDDITTENIWLFFHTKQIDCVTCKSISVSHSTARRVPFVFFLATFWRYLWSLIEQTHGNVASLCLFHVAWKVFFVSISGGIQSSPGQARKYVLSHLHHCYRAWREIYSWIETGNIIGQPADVQLKRTRNTRMCQDGRGNNRRVISSKFFNTSTLLLRPLFHASNTN